jgi:anti-sigma regulatory factor (Ser/Thr protein kinase)
VRRVIELEIPPRRDHLALARLVVESTVSLTGALPETRIDDLRLAVSEGCTNALDAQAAAGTEAPITLRVVVDDDAVTVTISDQAGGFEPGEVEAAPAATDPHRLRHERGLGIPIMRSLVDRVGYEAVPGGTVLTLVVDR